MIDFESSLTQLAEDNLLRELSTIEDKHGSHVTIHGKEYVNFASNDYLGLSENPGAIKAAKQALDDWGTGATASRLICGHTSEHARAEQAIATLKSRDAALLFPTGYMANLALFSTLAGKQDTIIVDRLAHASIIDAARLSGAKLLVFEHNDVASLKKVLTRYRSKFENVYVATEAVFSMDGDIAPIPDLLAICNQQQATLIVDEAHSTGVLGDGGRGIEEHFDIKGQIPIIMGTCSKALGAQGGFIAGSKELVRYLITTARSFIYTTGIAPSVCATITANIEYLLKHQKLVKDYHAKLDFFQKEAAKKKVPLKSHSAIFPFIIGCNQEALAAADKLRQAGILAVAIREPTVLKGTARLRITVTAAHKKEELTQLLEHLLISY